MGLPVSVHVRAVEVDVPTVAGQVERFFEDIRRFDRIFSLWRSDSDLCRVRRGEVSPADVAPELLEVVDLCTVAESLTQGWFNPWTAGRQTLAGFDPTGLVKGLAVERSADRHLADGEHDFCVNAGGDILAWSREGAEPWRFGVENPADRDKFIAVVTLARGALATSGNAARGPHIRDPTTGRLADALGSVTVWGESLTWTDAVATAAFASGTRWTWLEALTGYGHLVVDPGGTVLAAAESSEHPTWSPDVAARQT